MYDAESVEEQAWIGADESQTPADAAQADVAGDLPVEPVLDPAAATDAECVRDALLRFYLYAQRPEATSVDGATPVPALFHPYRDLTRVRYDYPLCVNGNDAAFAFRSLTSLVDEALERVAKEGDDRERLRRQLYRVEASIKSNLETHQDKALPARWDAAAQALLAAGDFDNDRRTRLRDELERTRSALPTAGRLVDCDAATAGVLFRELAGAHWREKSAAWKVELDTLMARLRDILDADKSRSAAARSPQHLRESLAENDMDFEALSSIIATGGGSKGMPEPRRARITRALDSLTRLRGVFGLGEAPDDAPFDTADVVATSAAAVAAHESRMTTLVAFFKAVHIATLEAANRYRESIHDAFFATFDRGHLTEDEFSLCPPVLLHVTPASLTHAEAGELLDMLGSGVPVKALVEINDLTGESQALGPSVAVWSRRLGRAAMAMGEVFVTQVPVSRAEDLQSRLIDGFNFGGPALFVVYTGDERGQGLSRYLMAEAAAESRLFPTFTFDPGRGETGADRMNVGANAHADADWPVESLPHLKSDGSESKIDLAFTPADFLACDRRFDDQFWHVERSQWHDDMLPLADYIEKGCTDGDAAIPYIVTVRADGRLGRAVVTRGVVATAVDARSSWRSLQEQGGINNSFAARLLSSEKHKLADAMAREVKSIEAGYAAQLDQDLGDLTKEIVHRIVNRLLTQEGLSGPLPAEAAPAPSRAPSTAPAAASAEPPPAVAEVDEPEDALGSFDDPYIDTPLCTSCNECTQLNPQMFAYNENKQALIKDATAGPFQHLVRAAEVCPVRIIHPGKPSNPGEPGLNEWIERAAPFN